VNRVGYVKHNLPVPTSLGSGNFVSNVLSEADFEKKYRLANIDRAKAALELIAQCCQKNGISPQALSGGSRMRRVSKVRRELPRRLTEELNLSFAEVARFLGVSTSAVAKALKD
jgi:hypothetical protein